LGDWGAGGREGGREKWLYVVFVLVQAAGRLSQKS